MLAVGALATALAPDPLRSLAGELPRLDGALALAANVALFLAARTLATTVARRRRLAVALAVASAAAAAYALAQLAGVDPLDWGLAWPGRPVGAQGNPVFLAGALLILLPFAVAEVAQRVALGRSRAAAALALPAAAIAIALLAARGRGALVGLAAGAVVFVAAASSAAGRRGGARRFLAGALALGVALALLPPLLGRPLPGLDPSAGTARQRLLLWRATLELFTAHPARLAIGWGPESLALVLPRHLPEELPALVWEPGRTQDRAHNALLDTTATLGLAGLAAAAALALFGLARPLARCGLGRTAPRRSGEVWLDAACAAAIAGHVAELQFGFRTAATGALAALVLGLATARRDAGATSAEAHPIRGALAGWLGGTALALLGQAFGSAPRPPREALFVLAAAALAVALPLGAGLVRREALGRALPLALFALAVGWGAAASARASATPSEMRATAALLPLLLGTLGAAWSVARRPEMRGRAPVAAGIAGLALALALAGALVWGVARPLGAGVAFGLGRAELEGGEADYAAAAFAAAAARAPSLVDPVRLEARAAARLAAATGSPDLRDRRFAAAVATLDRARARHPEDPDLDPESARVLARWSEFAPDPATRTERLIAARARLEAAAERAPASAVVQRNLAAVLLDLGELDQARLAAERSASLEPRSLEAALLVARARAAAGEVEGAIEALRAADRLDPARTARLLESLARGMPRSFEAQRDLALLALARGLPAEAAAALARARSLAAPADDSALAALEVRVAAASAAGPEVE